VSEWWYSCVTMVLQVVRWCMDQAAGATARKEAWNNTAGCRCGYVVVTLLLDCC
jgi:hypothetical protein